MSLRELRYKFLSRFGRKEIREHYKYKLGVIEQTKLENKNILSMLSKKLLQIENRQINHEWILKGLVQSFIYIFDLNMRKIQPVLLDAYKKQILEFKLFDEEFYILNYPDCKKYNLSPLDHYLKIGWQMNYNPSEKFNTKFYLTQRPNLNECPLIHYLIEGRFQACYPVTSINSDVKNSIKHNNSKKEKVVYTCLVGDYDNLIQHKYISEDYDYVCFSDNKEWLEKGQIGIWEIRPLVISNLDTTRINRYHKINPHIVLQEYEESIYIDSNIDILTPFLFDLIKARNSEILLPRHFDTVCAYNHAKWILRDNVDYPKLVNKFIDLMKKSGFPDNYGMTENNIIYRKHHENSVIKIMEEWWFYVRDYCKRDQLSFPFVLWKNNVSIADISFLNARSDIENFMMVKHQKRRPDVK